MASVLLKSPNQKNDEYNTPKYAWEYIKNIIPKGVTIYEPFWNKTSKSAEYLRELTGNKIIFENIDFFKHKEYNLDYDILISNPPYSCKKEIFNMLKEIDKPFIFIIPISTIAKKYYIEWLNKVGEDNVSICIPPKRIHFEMMNSKKSSSCFDVIYLCYKIKTERQINYLT